MYLNIIKLLQKKKQRIPNTTDGLLFQFFDFF